MEAVMIAGVAVVAVGGVYAGLDLLNDLGVRIEKRRPEVAGRSVSRRCLFTAQGGVKKMAGMHV
jgi:hypothetical protein